MKLEYFFSFVISHLTSFYDIITLNVTSPLSEFIFFISTYYMKIVIDSHDKLVKCIYIV